MLAHLARYTHRTAICNSRLVDVTDAQVEFLYNNYRRSRRTASCGFARMSSCAAFSCMSFPTASIVSGIMHFSPSLAAVKISRTCVNSYASSPNRPRAPIRRRKPRTRNPDSRRRSSCVHPLARLRRLHAPHRDLCASDTLAPFAATRHDDHAAAPQVRRYPASVACLRDRRWRGSPSLTNQRVATRRKSASPGCSAIRQLGAAARGCRRRHKPAQRRPKRPIAPSSVCTSPIAPFPDRAFVQFGLCEVASGVAPRASR